MQPQPKIKLVARHSSGSYPVFIHDNWLSEIGREIGRTRTKLAVITDENVQRLIASGFCSALQDQCPATSVFAIAPGEPSKSFGQTEWLLQKCLAAGLDRNSTIVALGGGVVGDLAGFVAATFMRGIQLVQVPTTLLAQVDSSIGGKTGINLPGAKNSVGVFWQPQSVYIDTALCATLPDDQYTSGLAEVVKYAVIMDAELFTLLESNIDKINRRDPDLLVQIVRRCCELKMQIVGEDERETTGRRMILNYGHTFGHAIESVFGYGNRLHGHAVAAGMMTAGRLAVLMGLIPNEDVDRQQRLLHSLNIPCQFPTDRHSELMQAMKSDKKSAGGQPRFVLPTGIGSVEIHEADPELVVRAMQHERGENR